MFIKLHSCDTDHDIIIRVSDIDLIEKSSLHSAKSTVHAEGDVYSVKESVAEIEAALANHGLLITVGDSRPTPDTTASAASK